MRSLIKDEGGQVIVEYILTLFVAATIVGLMAGVFRSSLATLWTQLACEIAAPCPGCPYSEGRLSCGNR